MNENNGDVYIVKYAAGSKFNDIYICAKSSTPGGRKDNMNDEQRIQAKAKFLNDDKIAYTTVYKKDMEQFSAGDDCMEGLTEKLRAIISTEVAFVAKEMNNGWTKISMRSKSKDIAQICKKFDGGGHKLAAGCTIKSGIDESIKKILDALH